MMILNQNLFYSRRLGRSFNFNSVCQRHDFDFSNIDFAAGVVLLECEVALFEGFGEVEVLIKFIVINRDFDARHFATTPDIIANFHFIGEPGVRLDMLLIDMAHAIN